MCLHLVEEAIVRQVCEYDIKMEQTCLSLSFIKIEDFYIDIMVFKCQFKICKLKP